MHCRRALASGAATYHAALPVREQVAQVLGCTGARLRFRSSGRAAARFDIASTTTSLRRDEHRSWRSA